VALFYGPVFWPCIWNAFGPAFGRTKWPGILAVWYGVYTIA